MDGDVVPVRATPCVAPCRLRYEAPRVAYASHEQWVELLMAVEAEMSWGVLAVLEEVRQSRPRPGAQLAWTMYDSFLFGLTRLDQVFSPVLARVERLLLCAEGARLPREAELWAVRVVHEMLVRVETALNVAVPTAVRLMPIMLAGPVFAVNEHTLEHLHEIAVHTVREAMQQEFAMGTGMRTLRSRGESEFYTLFHRNFVELSTASQLITLTRAEWTATCVAIAQLASKHGLSSDLGEVLHDRVRWGPVTWRGW